MSQSKKNISKKNRVELVAFLVLLVILFLFLSVYFSSKNKNIFTSILTSIESDKRSNKKLIPTNAPTPIPRPIPHGTKGFTVGQSDKTVPQFRKGSIDPYDPAKGQTQTVTIAVKHSQPVTKVTATLTTDHATSQPYSFKLISGSDTDGDWQGSWPVTDSYLYTYVLTLNAVSSGSPGSVTITLR